MWSKKLLTVITFLCIASVVLANLPILMWHGFLADPKIDCDFMKEWIMKEIGENVTIKSVDLTVNMLNEQAASALIHPLHQIDLVCNEIAHDDNLKNGFHAVGLSQGGQFMRGLVQRCPQAKVVNLLTFGSQHQGIYGLPNCSENNLSCRLLRKFLNLFAYTDWAQKHIAQATYWHDPINVWQYKKRSTFIADINNERTINKDYIERLQRLNKFVMVKFLRDEIVQPLATTQFGFYRPGSDEMSAIQNLTESEIYRKDKLGLKQMMKDGKLIFLEIDKEHLNFSAEWFSKEIIPLLKENGGKLT